LKQSRKKNKILVLLCNEIKTAINEFHNRARALLPNNTQQREKKSIQFVSLLRRG